MNSDILLNKIRRVAEELVARYPSLFTSNFEKNKQALSQVSVIHARSLRNQLAGAITRLVQERGLGEESAKEATLGERIIAQVEQEFQTVPLQTAVEAGASTEAKQENSSAA